MHARHPVQLGAHGRCWRGSGRDGLGAGRKKPLRNPPPNWNQTVTKEADASGQEFDAKQMELIQKVTAYFNQMGDMKGNFVQSSADNKRMRGKFYSSGPGNSASNTICRASRSSSLTANTWRSRIST